MIPFLVCGFGKSTLSNLVKECFGSDFPDIFRKMQIDYIYRYLKDLRAESVLLEFEYVDRDFLEDHTRFYVKRFSSAGHKCARLHFFSHRIDHESINDLLAKTGDGHLAADLQDNYLGFMIVKPLPQTFIGKTCLKHYADINRGEAKRALTRTYDVNLFGIELHVDSIAFQEQDKVVSACATTSIWSALHALDWLQVRDIPSCSEITTNAINFIEGSSNSFPNKELSNKQIMRALDVEGLRHHSEPLESADQTDFLRSVSCYIDSGFPLVLGVDVYSLESGSPSKLAGHAVTILGYRSDAEDSAIYIHDDRLGPFARATIRRFDDFNASGELRGKWGLVLQEKDDEGRWKPAHEILLPSSLIVPAHKKVRLPLRFALNTCDSILDEYQAQLNDIQENRKDADTSEYVNAVRFDVALEEIAAIKREVWSTQHATSFESTSGESLPLSPDDLAEMERQRLSFLTGSYARFQWVGRFFFQNQAAFRILIDATDIPQGHAVSAVVIENTVASDVILAGMRIYAASPNAPDRLKPKNENFFRSFLRRLNPKDQDISDHLNSTYGELRAPKYLKETEFESGNIRRNASVRTFYESTHETLPEVFDKLTGGEKKPHVIWAIAQDGALLIGDEIHQMGHPCLTGFKPARIAGELKPIAGGWVINSKSGRYSGDYRNGNIFLENAADKFRSIFYNSRHGIEVEHMVAKAGKGQN